MTPILKTRFRFTASLLVLAVARLHGVAAESARLVDSVDTLIGTGKDGHTFPGPCLPHGFVKLSPDTDRKSPGGYHFDGAIRYFSHNHISGMGGPKYGNVGVMPFVGPLNPTRLGHLSDKADEIGRPGYYKVLLTEHAITAELTATMHAGMHRYTFPAHAQSRILVDVGATLQGTGVGWDSSMPTGGHVAVDPAAQEITGENSFVGGRASGVWKVYFVAKFDTKFAAFGTWVDAAIQEGGTSAEGAFIGGYCGFPTTAGQVVTVKVGLSFISVAQARKNLDREIPHWDFAAVREAASDAWETEFGKIRVEGGTARDRTIFYTGLYHMLLMPTDFTGENPHFDFGRPYYDDFLCIWDLFRVNLPLHVLINAPRATDMLNSLLDVYRHDGWLPDSRCALTYDQVQNGTNADVLFADAMAKNLAGVDYATAAQAMIKHAEQPSPDPRHFGRAGIAEYIARGYVPVGTKNSVSRTLEYVYNDYCIAQVCARLGLKPEAERYHTRASWYRNVWDAKIGFMRGRNSDGTWVEPFDPGKVESWGVSFYEGKAFHWGYYAPHDVAGLVQLYGGEETFAARLDDMCANRYAAWNEPNMLNPYLFPWTGRPDRTAWHVRRIMQVYDATPNGLPGNDDSGTTSGWYLWSALGIYPVAGQDFYVIGSPIFTKTTIRVSGGRDFTISAPGASPDNMYVQSCVLNGAPHDRAFLRHEDLTHGGTLDLVMGSAPSAWATKTRPPSMSDRPVAPARSGAAHHPK